MIELFDRLSPHERIMSLSTAITHIKTEEDATPGPIPYGVSRPAEESAQRPRPWFHVKTSLIYKTGEYNQHYMVPIEALLPEGTPRPVEIVIKKILLHKTAWYGGKQVTRMFFIFVEEPLERATRPTRSIPPSMQSYMALRGPRPPTPSSWTTEDEEPATTTQFILLKTGARVYKQRGDLHTSKANKRAKARRQRR